MEYLAIIIIKRRNYNVHLILVILNNKLINNNINYIIQYFIFMDPPCIVN